MFTNLVKKLPEHCINLYQDEMITIFIDPEIERVKSVVVMYFNVKSLNFRERYPNSIVNTAHCSSEAQALVAALSEGLKRHSEIKPEELFCPLYYSIMSSEQMESAIEALHTYLPVKRLLTTFKLDLVQHSIEEALAALPPESIRPLDYVHEDELDKAYAAFVAAFSNNMQKRPYTKEYFLELIRRQEVMAVRDSEGNLAGVEIFKKTGRAMYVDYYFKLREGHNFGMPLMNSIVSLELQKARELGVTSILMNYIPENKAISRRREICFYKADNCLDIMQLFAQDFPHAEA